MFKKCFSLMLALCLLLSTASVAFMEEDINFAEASVDSELAEASVDEAPAQELGEVAAEASAPAQAEEPAPAAVEEPAPAVEPAPVVEPAPLAEASHTEFLLTGKATLNVSRGDTVQILLDGLTAKKYKSSKKSVAKVTSTGLVTAVGGGTAKITVTITKKKKFVLTLKVSDPTKPTKVYFTQDGNVVSGTITVNRGSSITLVPVALNAAGTAADTGFKWSSSKKKYASVSKQGVITGKKTGTTTITCTTTRGKKKAKIKVKVVDANRATSVSINSESYIYMDIGSRLQLTATMQPENSTSTLKWSSSKKKVATVSKNGLVKAKKKGRTVITVKTSSGKKASITIQVLKAAGPASDLYFDVSEGEELFVGLESYIPVITDPLNAQAEVKFYCDPAMADITNTERTGDLKWIASVVPKTTGYLVLTATDAVTGISKSIGLTVKEPPKPESVSFPDVNGTVNMALGETRELAYSVLPKTSYSHPANHALVTVEPQIATVDYVRANYKRNCPGTMKYTLTVHALQPGTATVTLILGQDTPNFTPLTASFQLVIA